MHWDSHSFHSDLIHKFRKSIIKSFVTNTAIVGEPALVSLAGRTHSSSLGTTGFQLPSHGLHSWTDVLAYPILVENCDGAMWARESLGVRGFRASAVVVGQILQPGTVPAPARSRAARGHKDNPSPHSGDKGGRVWDWKSAYRSGSAVKHSICLS